MTSAKSSSPQLSKAQYANTALVVLGRVMRLRRPPFRQQFLRVGMDEVPESGVEVQIAPGEASLTFNKKSVCVRWAEAERAFTFTGANGVKKSVVVNWDALGPDYLDGLKAIQSVEPDGPRSIFFHVFYRARPLYRAIPLALGGALPTFRKRLRSCQFPVKIQLGPGLDPRVEDAAGNVMMVVEWGGIGAPPYILTHRNERVPYEELYEGGLQD